jgi:hypothetical protein
MLAVYFIGVNGLILIHNYQVKYCESRFKILSVFHLKTSKKFKIAVIPDCFAEICIS